MKKKYPKVEKIDTDQVEDLMNRARSNTLTVQDIDIIQNMFETLLYIYGLLEQKDVQLKRLLKQILGIKSEKTKKIKKDLQDDNASGKPDETDTEAEEPIEDSREPEPAPDPKPEPKGHGRIGADQYTGAEQLYISHSQLKPGDPCPECDKGKVYQWQPGVFLYISGRPPVQATVYRLEKLRCNLCGMIFQAELPDHLVEVGGTSKHFDESAKSIIGILRYGSGFPMTRLAALQKSLGVPLPQSTQWDKLVEAAEAMVPVFEQFKLQAAQGSLFHTDDTGMKVLAIMKIIDEELEKADGKRIRTGIFTTGIVSIVGEHKIVLYFTGRKHSGENFADLLEQRQSDRDPPLLMCDAKKGNAPKNHEVIECNCNTHARRNFVNVADDFPDQCLYVIVDVFGRIYKNDAFAKQRDMTPDQRLQFHREKSGPIMEGFKTWLHDQFEQNLVEPNCSLGKAIQYIINHWPKLTRFLQIPGAPLDNNLCERILKKSILHRKNSMFFKTENGARIGDMFMSLIHTCVEYGANVFDYLTQLQIHCSRVSKDPGQWLPWNYKETLAGL